jgi:hypothetical protein
VNTDQLPGQVVDHPFGEAKIILNDATQVSSQPGRKVNFLVNWTIKYKEHWERPDESIFLEVKLQGLHDYELFVGNLGQARLIEA